MSVLFAAVALLAIVQDKPAFDLRYDRVKDISLAQANLGLAFTDGGMLAGMKFGRQWEGQYRPATTPESTVIVMIYSISERWTFLKHEDMAILADDVRVRPKIIDRDREVQFGEGTVTEVLQYRMTFADLVATGNASSVEVAVGPKRWSLNSAQIDAVRQMSDHLKLDSRDATAALEERERRESEAAKALADAAQAEALAKAEAVVKKRHRLDPYRDAVAGAVDKARKAVNKLPNRVRSTTGEKVKWRTFDREMEPAIKEHKLTAKDISEILADYPLNCHPLDFLVRLF